jgi:hypothetical protein
MAQKELSYEFIHETGGRKYFLVKEAENEYFIFRTPPTSFEKSKNRVDLANWGGENIAWGTVPAKIRDCVSRKKVKPDPKNPEILISQT